ncbi:NUDIX domain-containing protein [Paenibacillus sp. GCM10027626]|uniref:NUDIX hydrolase n=1 Tax=Paenibacillus sp. GCM10027626 TaxID=3273411 RepID=UPI00362D5B25
MENELLQIFDENHRPIGTATRSEVHKAGYWHETFHCWFISREAGEAYIFLQIRSDLKKDYPSLYDITAAGHILAHETIADGVREVREEIGIDVTINDLVSLGVMNYCVLSEEIRDKELAHVFLYETNNTLTFDDFTLQKEEVAGMIRVNLKDFFALWNHVQEEVRVEGFVIDEAGEKVFFSENAGKDRFVPHEQAYYEHVLEAILVYLQR